MSGGIRTEKGDPTDQALKNIDHALAVARFHTRDVDYVRGVVAALRIIAEERYEMLATARATIARLEKQHYETLLAKAVKR